MEINKVKENETLRVAIEGRVDTTTAPVLESEIKTALPGVKELVLDFANVQYISSAGLRVLLSTQKIMNKQGSMKLCNVSSEVNEVFELTGFADILTIE